MIVNETFLTMDPVLLIAYMLLVVHENQAKFNSNINTLLTNRLHYKPIGFASTGVPFFIKCRQGQELYSRDNPEFDNDFVKAIAQQRFWDREFIEECSD